MNSIIVFFSEPNWLATIIVYFLVVYIFFKIVHFFLSNYSWYPRILDFLKYAVYCILIFEFGLRVIGIYQTYFEKKFGKYESMYKFRPQKIIHKRTPNDSLFLESNGEFKYLFKTNNWGYSDREWNDINENNLKILALGDSFTEGFGAEQDSSWVVQISNKYLNRNFKWYNAGISASDPFANLYNLQHELYQLNPDVVVQIFSNQDFDEDFLYRGGYERFKNHRLEYPKQPVFEYIYAYSHIVRLFQNFLTKKNYYIDLEQLKNNQLEYHYDQLIKLYNNWAVKNKTQVILVYFNTDSYYYKNGEKSPIDQTAKDISDYLRVESITECYQGAIQQDYNAFNSLWWQNDGHHNAEGYRLLSNCIYERIQPVVDSLYSAKKQN